LAAALELKHVFAFGGWYVILDSGDCMAHRVRFEVPERDLGKSDVVFKVWRNGIRFGMLAVSRGSIVWFPKNKKWGYKAGWVEFQRFMSENGSRWERR
jgi:hypothetical protein